MSELRYCIVQDFNSCQNAAFTIYLHNILAERNDGSKNALRTAKQPDIVSSLYKTAF